MYAAIAIMSSRVSLATGFFINCVATPARVPR